MKTTPEPLFHIVLVHPQIPPNTGNIGRLCVGTHCRLHLIKPLGFDIGDSARKRAGLDYWEKLDLEVHEGIDSFLAQYAYRRDRFFLTSTHARKIFTEPHYLPGDFFFFGPETQGLTPSMQERIGGPTVYIPCFREIRSFNIANAVGMVLFEAWRQNGFLGWTPELAGWEKSKE